MKKKILIVVPTLSAGGSERVISILFNHFDRNRFEVFLIILDSTNVFYSLTNVNNVFYLKKKDVKSSVMTIFRIIRKEKPHVILATMASLNILLSVIHIFYPRFKLFIRESTFPSIHFKSIKFGFVYERLIKLFYPFSHRIICQSNDMLLDLNLNYGIRKSKMVVINNPVNVDHFPLKVNGRKVRPTFITVARLDLAKGYNRILRSLAFMKIDFEYIIVGDFTRNEYNYQLRDEFDQLVTELGLTDRIRMVGVSKFPQTYLEQADVYLHGSYYEGFPNALLEAGSVGLPVVSFSTTGISEILQNGVNGFIVEDNNLRAFADAIYAAIEQPYDPERIREMINSRFNVDVIVNKYQDLLDSNV